IRTSPKLRPKRGSIAALVAVSSDCGGDCRARSTAWPASGCNAAAAPMPAGLRCTPLHADPVIALESDHAPPNRNWIRAVVMPRLRLWPRWPGGFRARIALVGHVLPETSVIVIPICAGNVAEFTPQSRSAGDNFPHGAMRPHIASKARA